MFQHSQTNLLEISMQSSKRDKFAIKNKPCCGKNLVTGYIPEWGTKTLTLFAYIGTFLYSRIWPGLIVYRKLFKFLWVGETILYLWAFWHFLNAAHKDPGFIPRGNLSLPEKNEQVKEKTGEADQIENRAELELSNQLPALNDQEINNKESENIEKNTPSASQKNSSSLKEKKSKNLKIIL